VAYSEAIIVSKNFLLLLLFVVSGIMNTVRVPDNKLPTKEEEKGKKEC